MQPPDGAAQPKQEGEQLQPTMEQFKSQQSALHQQQSGPYGKANKADVVHDPGVHYMPCMSLLANEVIHLTS